MEFRVGKVKVQGVTMELETRDRAKQAVDRERPIGVLTGNTQKGNDTDWRETRK